MQGCQPHLIAAEMKTTDAMGDGDAEQSHPSEGLLTMPCSSLALSLQPAKLQLPKPSKKLTALRMKPLSSRFLTRAACFIHAVLSVSKMQTAMKVSCTTALAVKYSLHGSGLQRQSEVVKCPLGQRQGLKLRVNLVARADAIGQ